MGEKLTMTTDLAHYKTYLQGKHYSEKSIKHSINIAKRLLNACSEQDIVSKPADQLIERIEVSRTTKTTINWYRGLISRFKRYLSDIGVTA